MFSFAENQDTIFHLLKMKACRVAIIRFLASDKIKAFGFEEIKEYLMSNIPSIEHNDKLIHDTIDWLTQDGMIVAFYEPEHKSAYCGFYQITNKGIDIHEGKEPWSVEYTPRPLLYTHDEGVRTSFTDPDKLFRFNLTADDIMNDETREALMSFIQEGREKELPSSHYRGIMEKLSGMDDHITALSNYYSDIVVRLRDMEALMERICAAADVDTDVSLENKAESVPTGVAMAEAMEMSRAKTAGDAIVIANNLKSKYATIPNYTKHTTIEEFMRALYEGGEPVASMCMNYTLYITACNFGLFSNRAKTWLSQMEFGGITSIKLSEEEASKLITPLKYNTLQPISHYFHPVSETSMVAVASKNMMFKGDSDALIEYFLIEKSVQKENTTNSDKEEMSKEEKSFEISDKFIDGNTCLQEPKTSWMYEITVDNKTYRIHQYHAQILEHMGVNGNKFLYKHVEDILSRYIEKVWYYRAHKTLMELKKWKFITMKGKVTRRSSIKNARTIYSYTLTSLGTKIVDILTSPKHASEQVQEQVQEQIAAEA
jgi:hypothetical protein